MSADISASASAYEAARIVDWGESVPVHGW